ncbi:MAG: flagellar assembly peptidoglycan hydrolase FlgJ, partial [FCB group bacterium]|nr:flagellar assembly peptidoglycan hydrolase FlgJ [FCB group bacterium]
VFDTQSLAALKQGLKKDDQQALKATARQFEALFLQMVMKSMRASIPQEGMFDSDQTRFYQELLDAQMSQVLSGKGGTGLAAMIERQLSQTSDVAADPTDGFPLDATRQLLRLEQFQRPFPLAPESTVPPAGLPLEGSPIRSSSSAAVPVSPTGAANSANKQAADFASSIWPDAVAASRTTGIPPDYLVAHAALESGWGNNVPRLPDGRSSHNLFGIKAGKSWDGSVVEARTTEYENGQPLSRTERFRAYDSFADAFHDYAQLLTQSPRYSTVLSSRDPAGFAQGLQRAGYATDPAYAAKLEQIIGGPTLRKALAG